MRSLESLARVIICKMMGYEMGSYPANKSRSVFLTLVFFGKVIFDAKFGASSKLRLPQRFHCNHHCFSDYNVDSMYHHHRHHQHDSNQINCYCYKYLRNLLKSLRIRIMAQNYYRDLRLKFPLIFAVVAPLKKNFF